MAHSKQAKKRIRVNERRRIRNRTHRSAARTMLRRAEAAIESGDVDEAREAIAKAITQLDRTAAKGVIHKNTAARHKSRLMNKFNNLQASAS